ncbi:MAG TPA: paraquat-inducible protein A [Tepidisphaeraceae bacterium]|jgi:paraquat-inducible protein A|nr:paraquat-inducible protein A [Tepidisphaeraceae bacterium]
MPDLIACRVCGQVHAPEPLEPGTLAECIQCGSTMKRHFAHSLHLTGALSLAALILYWPANIFPILKMEIYGASSQNTVWQGCVRLFQDRDYIVAVIVFLASILIPLLKLLGLFLLVIARKFKMSRWRMARMWIYKIIDAIGRWAMLDVFVLAILVSLVKLQRLATIIPGPGLLAFSAVVVLTILASACFDPEVIWKDEEAA